MVMKKRPLIIPKEEKEKETKTERNLKSDRNKPTNQEN
jgi:hypothetical protein